MTNTITSFAEALNNRSVAATYNARRADGGLKWAVEKRWAMETVQKNDDLLKCSPKSFVAAVLSLASMGLSLDPTRRQAYLIPRAHRRGAQPSCLATPSYLGLEYLARQAPEIANIQTNLVCERDDLYRTGVDRNGPYVEHEMARGDRGEVTHAYCVTYYANGTRQIEVMTREELDQCEKIATQANGNKTPPSWKFWRAEMQKKSIMRRSSKHWPISSSRLTRAIEAMDKAEPMEWSQPEPVLMTKQQAQSIHELATQLGMSADAEIENICAVYGVDSLTDLDAGESPAIKRGLRNRAKLKGEAA